MNEESKAKRIADEFADERIDITVLAQHSHRLFTASMVARLHQFIRWHSHFTNGRDSDTHPIDLDRLEREGV